MFVRMTVSKMGSVDGLSTALYKAGEKYDLPDHLAGIFLREGWAEEDKTLDGTIEVKDEAQSKDGAGSLAGKAGRKKNR
jgi:hypothetical protein